MGVIKTIYPENVDDLIKKIRALEELGMEYSILSVYETKDHTSIFGFSLGNKHKVKKYMIVIKEKGE